MSEIHSGLAKGEAKKWLRLEVEKIIQEGRKHNPGVAVYIIGG